MDVFDDLKAKFDSFLTAHSAEISDALDVASKVAASPLAGAALGLVHTPASVQTAAVAFLTETEKHFAELAEAATAPAPSSPEPAAEAEPASTPPAVVPAVANAQP